MPVPLLRRPLFWMLERVLPGIDRERVWRRLDMHAPMPGEKLLEQRIAQRLERRWAPVLAGTLTAFVSAIVGVYGLAPRWVAWLEPGGGPLSILVPMTLGLVLHGAFIMIVHEATHGNLFGKRVDAWVGNVALGLLLLPYMAETYQALHHIHHRRPNRAGDTNWTPYRHALFSRSRLLYAVYELIPVVNNLDRIREKLPTDRRRVAAAWAVAVLTWAVLRPPVGWYLLVLAGLNLVNAMRLWVEHFGYWKGRVANTYWCPLSYGIGNHEIHHRRPRIPALALAIGLWFREKDGSVLTSAARMLLARDYQHFRIVQPDFSRDRI